MVCQRLRGLLSPLEGVTIDGEAHNATEALEFIQKKKPDVVILDIQMPDGNGFDVLQITKGHSPSTVVIIFTNYPFPQYRRKYLDAGADFFLDKSVEFEKLVELINQLSKVARIAKTN